MTSKKNFNYYAELYDAFYKNKDYEIEIENLLKRLRNKGLINTFNEVHSMKYWSLETIKLVLDSKGFKIIDTFDIISGSRINNDSWGATIIARKL